uniref:IS5 family transposase n=1 Tax=Myxococcus TaxID=32 RepID=UPI001142B06F
MARALVPDALWERISPLLPPHPPRPRGGRPPADDRACLRGIIFVLKTGIQWEDLSQEVLGVSGMSCWRRLRDWEAAGVWVKLHEQLLAALHRRRKTDLSRASADSSSVRALKRGAHWAKSDGPRQGGQQALPPRGQEGNPLAVRLTAANVTDVGQLLALVDSVPPIRGRRGHPLRRPEKLHSDKGFALRAKRYGLCQRSIVPRIAKPGIESSEKLGRYRWKVEQRLAHLHRFRRLRIRD